MTHRYIHVGINYGLGVPRTQSLEPFIKYLCDDWVRYTPTNWIIWTDKTTDQVASALRGLLTLNDQFVVFEIDPMKRDGTHYQWVWDWLSEPRYEGYRPPAAPMFSPPPPLPPMFLPPTKKG